MKKPRGKRVRLMDPYKVLNIGYDASEEEIKRAYRQLSRKYHPDANVGNPRQAEFEERFKEVQQAYNMVMDQKQGKIFNDAGTYGSQQPYGEGYTGSYYRGDFTQFWEEFFGSVYGNGGNGGNGYNGYGGAGNTGFNSGNQESAYFESAVHYINNGFFREGINVLSQIPEEKREAKWFYYYALANYRIGNNGIAVENAKAACALEPNNLNYRRLLDQLTGSESRYQRRSAYYGGNPANQPMGYCLNTCATISCLSLCCSGFRLGLPVMCCI